MTRPHRTPPHRTRPPEHHRLGRRVDGGPAVLLAESHGETGTHLRANVDAALAAELADYVA
ncbi:hypothetical protein AB0N28_00840 [Streptomyces sp. NPDC051130]|uniref:hypothetical protein n=1 Tax=Streptomyces sp. NPDC051130 TaxID=3157223 RepID=UPI00341ED56E